MRRIRYAVAMSLDGYIAGPHGEADWILMDPDIDFGEMMSQFDTLLIGRHSFESTQSMGESPESGMFAGMKTLVFSTTLRPDDYPGVTIVGEDYGSYLTRLKQAPGKDIWLFGGGLLFRSLLTAGFVDTVEVGVIPVLLGNGVPLFPPPAPQTALKLKSQMVYEKTGTIALEYEVQPPAA